VILRSYGMELEELRNADHIAGQQAKLDALLKEC
jgi:hypothetical protein